MVAFPKKGSGSVLDTIPPPFPLIPMIPDRECAADNVWTFALDDLADASGLSSVPSIIPNGAGKMSSAATHGIVAAHIANPIAIRFSTCTFMDNSLI